MSEEEQQEQQLIENFDSEELDDFGDKEYNLDSQDTAVSAGKTSKIMGGIVLSILVVGVLFFLFSSGEEEIDQTTGEVAVFNEPPAAGEGVETYNVAPLPEEEIEPIIESVTPDEEIISETLELEVPELPELKIADVPSLEEFSVEPEFAEDDIFLEEPEIDEIGDIDPEIGGEEIALPGEEIGGVDDAAPAPAGGSKDQRPSMMLMNGGSSSFSGSSSVVEFSSADTVSATKIRFPKRTIAQGKLIDAVLETAINSDLEGKVRGIVSRNIYADFGKAVLIPKGSRLIGSYSGTVARGQTRVLVNWERLIRPDAIDIEISSPATDQFGRSGVPGNVNNRYLELFNNSILLSLITIGTAMAIEGATNSGGVEETTDSNGDETVVAETSDIAAQEIISSISDTADTVLDGVLNVNPTITVPHGTRIKVFVNQDLVFPKTDNVSDENNILFIK